MEQQNLQNKNRTVFTAFVNFCMVWFFCFCIGSFIAQGILQWWEVNDFKEILNGIAKGTLLEYIPLVKLLNGILHLFRYLIPVLIFVFVFHKQKKWQYLKLNKPPTLLALGGSIGLVIFIYPFIAFVYYWNTILIPDAWIAQDILNMQQYFMAMDSIHDLFWNVLLFGIIAGVGEEFLFRGILQSFITKIFDNKHIGAIGTGVLFSIIHFQLEGFIPRFLLGTFFGYLLIFTQNLWIPALVHVFFNSFQVILPYFLPNLGGKVNEVQEISPFLAFFSLLFFSCLLIYLTKNTKDFKIKYNT